MYLFFKRFFDIFFAALFLILFAPLMLIVSLIIKLDSKGTVLYKQDRIGKNGKVYVMYKFRSMCTGAEKMEGGVFCEKDDARVTRIGKILRATSIDEFPQFFNVLKGDMSFIGPRPVLTYYPKKWEEYTKEEKIRFSVRPGITGLAAVKGRKTNTVEKRFYYDNYYVEHLSLWLDIKIIFLTIAVILTNSGNEDNGAAKVDNKGSGVCAETVALPVETAESALPVDDKKPEPEKVLSDDLRSEEVAASESGANYLKSVTKDFKQEKAIGNKTPGKRK